MAFCSCALPACPFPLPLPLPKRPGFCVGNGVLLAGLKGENWPASKGLVTAPRPGENGVVCPPGVRVPLVLVGPPRRGGGKNFEMDKTFSCKFRACQGQRQKLKKELFAYDHLVDFVKLEESDVSG